MQKNDNFKCNLVDIQDTAEEAANTSKRRERDKKDNRNTELEWNERLIMERRKGIQTD